ncbi:MAG: hypothetical protein ACI4O8_09915 [Aristaeellaceae bacterium]|nr:DUF624 domain-containing protein [Eubacteriales bacterium]
MSFFKNYFYGKSGQRDFTEQDLPTNRMQLFREVLKVRRSSMVGLNFLYLLCWIPAILWSYLNLVQLSAIAAGISDANLGDLIYSYLLVLFPLSAITGPFTMGISRVLRNWARDEHAYAAGDYFAGAKENWRQGLLYGLINGALPLLVCICWNFYTGMAGGSPLFYLPLAIALIAGLLWILSAQLMPTLIVTYRLRFTGVVRNAVLMTLAALPKAIAVKLATLAIPVVLLLLMQFAPAALRWAVPAALVLYAIFYLSFNRLITASYANACCEKYLNPKIEGAGVDIGLRRTEHGEESKK